MRWMVVAVVLTALAGCLDDSSTDDAGVTGDAPEVGVPAQAQEAKQAAEAGEPLGDQHGEPKVTSSAVETSPSGTGWEARQVFTYTNGVGPAVSADALIDIGAGGIEARAVTTGGYEVVIELVATGPDEQTARDALASMDIEHTDELSGDHLSVGWQVITPPYNPVGLPVSIGNVGRAAYVDAALPVHLAYELGLDSGSGDIDASGFAGPRLDADAGSGDVTVDGANFETIALDAGSGDITLDGLAGELSVGTGSGSHDVTGSFDRIEADSGSGDQDYKVTARTSGAWTFDAGSGSITVALERADGQAFDVQAENGSGSIDVELEDGETVSSDDDAVHVRSAGYGDAAVQTAIVADAGSGDITVTDA